ncbi:MAG: hypothetical protein Kapaf2KO_10500 [Candidatus Kapaibacteriales bacterium]
MRNLFVIAISICIYSTSFADEGLLGSWKFDKESEHLEEVDSTGRKMIDAFFSSMTYNFEESGRINLELMGELLSGDYKIYQDSMLIMFDNGGYGRARYELEGDNLALDIGKSPTKRITKILPLKRDKEAVFDYPTPELRPEKKNIDIESILGKKLTLLEKKRSDNSTGSPLLENDVITLKPGGERVYFLFEEENTDYWEYDEDEKAIFWGDYAKGHFFYLIDDSLPLYTLQAGRNGDIFVFKVED